MIVYLIAGQGERDAIATLLSGHTYEIRPYPDVAAFLAEADLEPPGCVLIDVQPSDPTAMRELRAIRRSLPIIALSSRANVALAVRAMKEGAADFLQKPIEPEKLDAAVRAALDESRAWFERGRKKRELLARFESLSTRERDVVDAVMHGCANREVASQLGIKPRTVEIHRSNAMSKLGARTLPDLVRIWLDVGSSLAQLNAE
ncbi:LuxR C-terminal-related transcriptional regulator [Methylocystis sp. IM3]|uniref:response regulator transcription factor n=1 Tax=Methylocystis sp. IM3 TaxID=3136722 RepID=UPI000FB93936|nr:MAG: response regulator transcription factor [Hyphomicrobiales bacterium]